MWGHHEFALLGGCRRRPFATCYIISHTFYNTDLQDEYVLFAPPTMDDEVAARLEETTIRRIIYVTLLPQPRLALNPLRLFVCTMSAIFDFGSLLTVLLLMICTCAYIREMRPTVFDPAPPAVRRRFSVA